MANLGGMFNAAEVAPREEFKVLDPGDYPVVITASEIKENSKKNGHFLELELSVVDGPAKGRKLFDSLNLDNPSAQAVEIAKATLSAICHAVGKLTVSDSQELHNIPMIAAVRKEPKKVNGSVVEGEFRNSINTYKPRSAAAPAATGPALGGTPAAPAAGSASGGLPWARSA
jgi:hypothetical protein